MGRVSFDPLAFRPPLRDSSLDAALSLSFMRLSLSAITVMTCLANSGYSRTNRSNCALSIEMTRQAERVITVALLKDESTNAISPSSAPGFAISMTFPPTTTDANPSNSTYMLVPASPSLNKVRPACKETIVRAPRKCAMRSTAPPAGLSICLGIQRLT